MKSPKNRLHRVLVVGATPAGVAATNKLGELGIPVTLVDKHTDLNEKLADDRYRLNSGVPFNFAHRPGLIRILGNPGIRCVLPATVTGAKHSRQGFAVKIERHQTFVDPNRCTLCGKCMAVCPVSDESGKAPISFASRMALPGRATIDKRQDPLCQANCPLGVNAQGYIALASAGRYDEALALVRKDNVLPGICGRVCHHPCEAACRRSEVDAPLAIRDIKRFLADHGRQNPVSGSPSDKPTRPEKIAVVGSGPAGLAAAADLAWNGFAVTLFEKKSKAGGLLRYGIGPYRLPREIIDEEIEAIVRMGVSLRTGHAIDLAQGLDELKKEFSAVILTVGTWADRRLGVPGEDLDGISGSLSFLERFSDNEIRSVEGNVAVIGGGNAAIDVSRAAIRLGAKSVQIVYRRTRAEMPAWEEEIHAAEAEGIRIMECRQVTEFVGKNGRLQGLRLVATRPGPADENGRSLPIPVEDGDTTVLPVDRVFLAIGQKGAYRFSGRGIRATAQGYLAADPTGQTDMPKVWAAGDAVSGASTVVQAMADGRAVAKAVMDELLGTDEPFDASDITRRPKGREFIPIDPNMVACMRTPMPEIALSARQGSFAEVAKGYDENQMKREACRCLQCASCSECLACVTACGVNRAIRHDEPAELLTENAGVVIIADPEMGMHIRGEDVIRAYGPKSAKSDVYAMLIRGFAAAAKAMALLKDTSSRPKGHGIAFVPPDPGLDERIRMGVFACRCNDSLGWTPQMDAYMENLNRRSDIVHAEMLPSACLPEGVGQIVATIRDRRLTRVVLASCVCCPLNFVCSACTQQRSRLKTGLFVGTGISRSMVQTVNLRGEALRMVEKDPDLAQTRFTAVMDSTIRLAAKLLPFPAPVRTYNFTTAVIGQSEAAATAAVTLAESGLDVVMLGTRKNPLEKPPLHPNIRSFVDGHVEAISGTLGNFRVFVKNGHTSWTFTVGGIVLGENSRKINLYRQHEDQREYRVHSTMQTSGSQGTPFIYPGTTSISGLFLADPPGIQLSKRTKGSAAAIMAAAAMPRGPRQSRGFTVSVNRELCRSCGRCIAVCPYQAIAFHSDGEGGYYARVDEALCKGCGNCISVCPSDAADSLYRDHLYLEKTVESMLAVSDTGRQ